MTDVFLDHPAFALGGLLVPSFMQPRSMQTVSLITPQAWALSGFQDLMVRGLDLSAIALDAGVLIGFAAVFFGFALWRFRFE